VGVAAEGGGVTADVGLDPWILLAGMAAVTHRVRLGGRLAPAAEVPATMLASTVSALEHLSRGRVILGLGPGDDEFVALLRRLLSGSAGVRPQGPPIFVWGGDVEHERAARLGDGLIQPAESPEQVAESATRLRQLRATQDRQGDFELWIEAPLPENRAAWAQSLAGYDGSGLTGVIVPWEPRLTDLLRNPDQEDDRGDLQIAAG
jgi:alkanesulfonate monooxygenase SsuD/methylene tetrahydromethanopterin reductase-like flavin-dependent oxidoreductase (luciferase family)